MSHPGLFCYLFNAGPVCLQRYCLCARTHVGELSMIVAEGRE